MVSIRNKALAYTLAAALSGTGLTLSGPAAGAGYASDYLESDTPTGADMLADAVVVRPLTFIASVVGAATWIVSLPFTLAGGNVGEAGTTLVVEPLGYTFVRPLGYMEGENPSVSMKTSMGSY